MNRFVILLHPIKNEESVRIDFESDMLETEIYEELKIEGYQIYQFIQEDFKYNMEEYELVDKEIQFFSLKREKITWFGFSRKMMTDLLIPPQKTFFYPYQYGHYFYLFTKNNIEKNDFENWLDLHFPDRFLDFDDAYAGLRKDQIELINEDDYLLITNHSYQKEFGLIGNDRILEKLTEKLLELNIESFEKTKFN